MEFLKDEQDPIVGSEKVNQVARELTHLLPDNIGQMSMTSQI